MGIGCSLLFTPANTLVAHTGYNVHFVPILQVQWHLLKYVRNYTNKDIILCRG